jgi:ubiquinone/menaquinone biosynthesis C-methylase UbiE
MSESEHWDQVYERRGPGEESWYRPHLERSLSLIEQAQLPADAAIIDVGGGASTLVDDLLLRGHTRLTVLDISAKAIATAQERLGPRAQTVTWLVGDVTRLELPEHEYDFWHDRAVFHFLRDEQARMRYVDAVRHALKPGGHVMVATFGPAGPERCSGLEVMRYTADEVHDQFGSAFQKLSSFTEIHETPGGAEQEFVYCFCRMAEWWIQPDHRLTMAGVSGRVSGS